MQIKKVAKISKGQDGAIYGSTLFRFDSKGNCSVFDVSGLNFEDVAVLSPVAEFRLDRSDEVVPHSNAVCFGCEFYEQGDIREMFDCEYHRYIQGATLYEGRIYSTEGFWNDKVNHPAIRIIDVATHGEKYFDIMEYGLLDEPECISFYKGKCLYSDYSGNLFEVKF